MATRRSKEAIVSKEPTLETISWADAIILNGMPKSIREAAIKARKPRGAGIFRCMEVVFDNKTCENFLKDPVIEVQFTHSARGGNPVGFVPEKGDDDKYSRGELFVLEVVELHLSEVERRQKAQNELHAAVRKRDEEESANMPLRRIANMLLHEALKAMEQSNGFAIEGVQGGFSIFKLIRTTQKDNEDEEAYVLCNMRSGNTYRVAIESDFDIEYVTLGDDDFEILEQLRVMKSNRIRERNEEVKKEIWEKYGLPYHEVD